MDHAAAPDDPLSCGPLPCNGVSLAFDEAHKPLTKAQARIEAERCYYCFDAPCIAACPTAIDIPSFIQRIAQDNRRGAARAILEANVFGGMCARDCPTEVLCEQACVRNDNEAKPVEIALLQRYATDAYLADPGAPLFIRAAPSLRRVAVVGGGPAGLACAHRLSVLGHEVVLFEGRPRLGGLNEYGIASYKTTGGFAQKEVEWLLSIGGIEARTGMMLGRDVFLDALLREYDAVFLGLGLAGVNALGVPEPAAEGVRDAVKFIAEVRQGLSMARAGRRVVVIGGGMTAIDAAVQSRMLGAEEVTIVYRRGPAGMAASGKEQKWAQVNGVTIRHWGMPKEVIAADGRVQGLRFVRTRMEAGRLVETDQHFIIEADMILKAIGQNFESSSVGQSVALRDGRIATDAEGQTSHPKLWAGGDCRHGGRDLTVEAVQHGKRAAMAIDRALRAGEA